MGGDGWSTTACPSFPLSPHRAPRVVSRQHAARSPRSLSFCPPRSRSTTPHAASRTHRLPTALASGGPGVVDAFSSPSPRAHVGSAGVTHALLLPSRMVEALAQSPFRFLSEDLRLAVFDELAADNAYAFSLVCEPFHATARVRHPDGIVTRTAPMCTSIPRIAWARAHGCPYNQWTCAHAAHGGHLEVLRWLRDNGCRWDLRTCAKAAEGGHLEVLRWARANKCPWSDTTCWGAVRGGHLHVLRWALENGCPWHGYLCSYAARLGHLEILKWMHTKHDLWACSDMIILCSDAALSGNLEMLQWLRSIGCAWNASICCSAASNGHLEVLQWARENDCPWDARTCAWAACYGSLEILQWARANGCPWDARTCADAAGNGHLGVLRWAHANGCSWDARTCADAAEGVPRRCSSGHVRTDVPGTRGRAPRPPCMATSKCSSGRQERLPVGRGDVRDSCSGRPPRGSPVGA